MAPISAPSADFEAGTFSGEYAISPLCLRALCRMCTLAVHFSPKFVDIYYMYMYRYIILFSTKPQNYLIYLFCRHASEFVKKITIIAPFTLELGLYTMYYLK